MRLRFIKFSVTLIVVFAIDCLLAGRLAINTEKKHANHFYPSCLSIHFVQ